MLMQLQQPEDLKLTSRCLLIGWGIGMSNVEAEEEMKQVKLVKRVKKEEGEEKKNHPMLWGMHTLKEVEDCIGME